MERVLGVRLRIYDIAVRLNLMLKKGYVKALYTL